MPRTFPGPGFQVLFQERPTPVDHRRPDAFAILRLQLLRKMERRNGNPSDGRGISFRRRIKGGLVRQTLGESCAGTSVVVSSRRYGPCQVVSTWCRMETAAYSYSRLCIWSEWKSGGCLWGIRRPFVLGVWHRVPKSLVVQSGT